MTQMHTSFHKSKPSCPNCGNVIDGYTGEAPKMNDGDWSICVYCLSRLAYENGDFRRLTADENDKFDQHEKALQMEQVAKFVKENRRS